MAFNKSPAKADVVADILEILGVPDNERLALSENLNKMSKATIGQLDYYIKEKIEPNFTEDAPPRTEANVPLHLVPADIDFVKNPKEMNAQLHMLPVISHRLIATFSNGDFPAMKRNIGIIDRITINVRKLTAQQLWDSINVYKGLPGDVAETDE